MFYHYSLNWRSLIEICDDNNINVYYGMTLDPITQDLLCHTMIRI
jgi:hypothetical protein